jgi:hypothetical protein
MNLSDDHRTRVILFTLNLDFLAGETASSVTVRATDSRHIPYNLIVEQVRKVANLPWLTAVFVRLPDDQSINGDLLVTLNMRGFNTNTVRIGIKSP